MGEARAGRAALVACLVAAVLVALMMVDMFPGLFGLAHEGHGPPSTAIRALWVIEGALSLAVLLGPGRSFFSGAWNQFRSHTASMDTLIALGTGSAWLYSTAVVAAPRAFPAGTAMPFYDASAVVIAFVLVGQWLEAKARRRTVDALESMGRLQPDDASVWREGRLHTVPVSTIAAGEEVLVRPGERVSVDGVVIEGRSHVDESLLTGESALVAKEPGATVFGGAVNRDGALRIRATEVGERSALRRIADLVRRAQTSRPPIANLVDRVSGVFVPVVMILAVLTFLAWFNFGTEPRLVHALVTSSAVLLIACPCALGLATPLSIAVGIGRIAQGGILVRDGAALQGAAALEVMVFDKTGTLTSGRPSLTDLVAATGSDARAALRCAAAAEMLSEHPLARALVQGARDRGLALPRAEGFEAVSGNGVRAVVEGRRVIVGSAAFLEREGVDTAGLASESERLARAARSVAWIGIDGRAAALCGVFDAPREDAAGVVRSLRERGIDVVMMTGDGAGTAAAVASSVGIERFLSSVLPGDKAAQIRTLQADGRRVGMVGDGVNDAPALAQADVGFAMGSGTEAAMASAAVTIVGGRLPAIPAAVDASRATLRNIKQNLFGAFVYNVVGIAVAAGALVPFLGSRGFLSPLVAGAAMALSSLTVVTNALRLRRLPLGAL